MRGSALICRRAARPVYRASRPVHRAAALCGAALACIAAPAWPEEIKVIQGAYLSASAKENQGNEDSPFARVPEFAPPAWALEPYSYSNYSLRFQGREVSAQVLASVQGGSSLPFALSVDQAWVKASFGEGWGLAFGRRELKWKDGGHWNPSDIVNPRLAWGAADAVAGGEPPGRDSIELFGLASFDDFNLDLSAATVFLGGLSGPERLPAYLAVGSILYPLELRAKAAFQAGTTPMLGAAARLSLSSGTLYADGLWLGDRPIAADFGFGPAAGSWFRYCAGAQWTFDTSASKLASSLSLQAEYLRQDDGLDSGQMSGYFDGLATMSLADGGVAYGQEAGKWDDRFFALGRDYLFAGLALGEIANQHLSLSESCILNIDDLSFALMSSLTWSPRSLLSICLSATNFGGRAGGEALRLPISAQYCLSLSRSF